MMMKNKSFQWVKTNFRRLGLSASSSTMGILMFLLSFIGGSLSVYAEDYNGRHGWPELKAPQKLIICEATKVPQEAILLESLSGLAAQAVNEGTFDEMVWIDIDTQDYNTILKKSCEALKIRHFQKMDVWTLLEYLKSKGVVKGYVRYNFLPYQEDTKITDHSSNVGTVYASLLKGALIDASLESKAKALGLSCLKDACTETMTQCFAKNKKLLSNETALSIHPSVSNIRDYAIAHKLMLFDDEKELTEKILKWVKPLTPILGWGCADEFDATSIITEWGHYNTASNWCVNLPFISAAAPSIPVEKVKEISLDEIDFNDSTYVHSFVMSDGDNMQWTMGAFVNHPCYLGNEYSRKEGLTWTTCPINLSVVSPVTWNEMLQYQTGRTSFIEYGAGYQYPDLFAKNCPNRKALLREFARRVNRHLKEMDIKIFGALFKDVDSPEAKEALQIYVEEMEDITGIIAIQYYPYELGKQVQWFKNKQGISIPVVTADYSLWDTTDKNRPYAGAPEYVASLINREAQDDPHGYSWTIVHAWSDFQHSSKITEKRAVGVNPIKATESLLNNKVRVVSLNEMLWRMRMQAHPEEVKALLKK